MSKRCPIYSRKHQLTDLAAQGKYVSMSQLYGGVLSEFSPRGQDPNDCIANNCGFTRSLHVQCINSISENKLYAWLPHMLLFHNFKGEGGLQRISGLKLAILEPISKNNIFGFSLSRIITAERFCWLRFCKKILYRISTSFFCSQYVLISLTS